jgi:hypothetical protein
MYYIDGDIFETKEDAFDYFLDGFDFTDGSSLDELCEKMEYTKEELLGTLLSLTLRNETFDNLGDRVLNAIEEIFQELVEEEDEEEEDGD